MIAVIGLAVVWVIGVMAVGMVIMYTRASDLNNSQDPLAAFIQGFMFGPDRSSGSFRTNTKIDRK